MPWPGAASWRKAQVRGREVDGARRRQLNSLAPNWQGPSRRGAPPALPSARSAPRLHSVRDDVACVDQSRPRLPRPCARPSRALLSSAWATRRNNAEAAAARHGRHRSGARLLPRGALRVLLCARACVPRRQPAGRERAGVAPLLRHHRVTLAPDASAAPTRSVAPVQRALRRGDCRHRRTRPRWRAVARPLPLQVPRSSALWQAPPARSPAALPRTWRRTATRRRGGTTCSCLGQRTCRTG